MFEHHEAIEYDFDVRGWDLLDFWRGRISPRKMLIRLKFLPLDSEFKKAFVPEAAAQHALGPMGYVLADFLDLFGYSKAGQKWQPYPRPEDRIREASARQHRFRALEEQAERNRLREADA